MARGLASKWEVAKMDHPKAVELSSAWGVSPLVAHLLMLRGIADAEQGTAFFNPSEADLSDPFLLSDMRAAVDRIEFARSRDERVLVFGDYDVDGIAGTAVMLKALERYGIAKREYGLPSRLGDGYGLNADRVRTAKEEGVDLIVTVDNGIKAHEAAAAARYAGVDLIVTDHHEFDGELPDALAVINPEREDRSYPGADICGAAVAFKLAYALTGSLEELDLVAMSTVADIVPLRGENRVLVSLGLRDMARSPRLGVAALAKAAGLKVHDVTSEQIAFRLAPRMNAAGRLGGEAVPLELLLAESSTEASRLARLLNDANTERRAIENVIFAEALEKLGDAVRPDQCSIVLASRQWHPGVIGIVAARLHDKFDRPAVLVAVDEDGLGRGSARSLTSFGMADALATCQDLLVRSGGHAAAAGLTIAEENLQAFSEAFEAEARKRTGGAPPGQTLEIDAIMSLSEIDPGLVNDLERLQPFGHMNPSPIFCTCGVSPVAGSVRRLNGGHIKFSVRHGPKLLSVIGFGKSDSIPDGLLARRIDIAFTPQFNTWNGETTIQLLLKDIGTP